VWSEALKALDNAPQRHQRKGSLSSDA